MLSLYQIEFNGDTIITTVTLYLNACEQHSEISIHPSLARHGAETLEIDVRQCKVFLGHIVSLRPA